jgi:hypothetical protein
LLPLLLLGAALLALLGAGAARAGEAALQPPDAATFRAYDQPSDAGEAVAVEWGASASDREGVVYLVEIASEEDYAKGAFKRAAQVPAVKRAKTDRRFKADYPKYYGFTDYPAFLGGSKANEQLHYVAVRPSDAYPPTPREIAKPTDEELNALSKVARARVEERVAYEERMEQDRLADERRRIDGQLYHFRLAIVAEGGPPVFVLDGGQPKVVSARAAPNYFKAYKLNNLLFSLVFCGVVLAFIRAARRNPNLFIRKIAGLEAVEEAIGRATEMGRSVFFVHGLTSVGSLSTIAALNILGRVARRSVDHDTALRVMNNDPIVMSVSREVVRQAYVESGRPDAFNPDHVAFVASEQFSYVAAVGGLMVREQPAAIFLVGYFYAESLFLAETGASTGAIQIAGTDSYTQLPFFITTCDYTLMGEELYAASAYLSREPLQLGSLRGQDVGKAFLMLIAVVGTLLTTCGVGWVQNLFKAF